MVVWANNCQDCLFCVVLVNKIVIFLCVCKAESHVTKDSTFISDIRDRGRIPASDLHNLLDVSASTVVCQWRK